VKISRLVGGRVPLGVNSYHSLSNGVTKGVKRRGDKGKVRAIILLTTGIVTGWEKIQRIVLVGGGGGGGRVRQGKGGEANATHKENQNKEECAKTHTERGPKEGWRVLISFSGVGILGLL